MSDSLTRRRLFCCGGQLRTKFCLKTRLLSGHQSASATEVKRFRARLRRCPTVTRRKTRKAESRLNINAGILDDDSFSVLVVTMTMRMNWGRQSDSTLDDHSSLAVRACLVCKSAPSTQPEIQTGEH